MGTFYNLLLNYKINGRSEDLEQILLYFTDFMDNIMIEYVSDMLPFEDLAQIGFLAILEAVNELDINIKDEFYLINYVYDKIVDAFECAYRESKNFLDSFEEVDEYQEDTTFDDAITNIKIDLVGDLISNLSEYERIILFQKYLNNNSNEFEISRILHIEPRHVRDKMKILDLKLKNPIIKREIKKYLD